MSNSYVPFVMTGCASLEGPGYFAYTSGALLKMSGCLVSAGMADQRSCCDLPNVVT